MLLASLRDPLPWPFWVTWAESVATSSRLLSVVTGKSVCHSLLTSAWAHIELFRLAARWVGLLAGSLLFYAYVSRNSVLCACTPITVRVFRPRE
mmetsp:Transcript_44757/g.143344  ORF Transcript_44757/g.143344 Transcript_44757/m.143344 type:complete len:94 (+) Transcript_44757:2073-2354(+)